jgi:Mandelate racemase / muconate lactonizing enzyme, N-terminal domain
LTSAAAMTVIPALSTGSEAAPAGPQAYPYLGRAEDYTDFRIIDPGLVVTKVGSWTQGSYGIVRVTTNDGHEGIGQLSSYEPDISATVLHRQVARHVLGSDPAQIDTLVDRVIDADMKFPYRRRRQPRRVLLQPFSRGPGWQGQDSGRPGLGSEDQRDLAREGFLSEKRKAGPERLETP